MNASLISIEAPFVGSNSPFDSTKEDAFKTASLIETEKGSEEDNSRAGRLSLFEQDIKRNIPNDAVKAIKIFRVFFIIINVIILFNNRS